MKVFPLQLRQFIVCVCVRERATVIIQYYIYYIKACESADTVQIVVSLKFPSSPRYVATTDMKIHHCQSWISVSNVISLCGRKKREIMDHVMKGINKYV